MLNVVIAQVNVIGQQQNMLTTVTYANRYGNEIHDHLDDLEHEYQHDNDSEYIPLDDNFFIDDDQHDDATLEPIMENDDTDEENNINTTPQTTHDMSHQIGNPINISNVGRPDLAPATEAYNQSIDAAEDDINNNTASKITGVETKHVQDPKTTGMEQHEEQNENESPVTEKFPDNTTSALIEQPLLSDIDSEKNFDGNEIIMTEEENIQEAERLGRLAATENST